MASFQQESKNLYSTAGASPTFMEIQTGCLQRIADATELMARRYQDLIDERNRFKEAMERARADRDSVTSTNKTLKGHVTRLREQVRSLEERLRNGNPTN